MLAGVASARGLERDQKKSRPGFAQAQTQPRWRRCRDIGLHHYVNYQVYLFKTQTVRGPFSSKAKLCKLYTKQLLHDIVIQESPVMLLVDLHNEDRACSYQKKLSLQS